MSPGISDDNRKRLGRINRNFFLHIHASKVHPHSLKSSYTFGLGVILGFLFMVMILTGVILMMNYTPSVERAYNSVKDIVFVVPGGKIYQEYPSLGCTWHGPGIIPSPDPGFLYRWIPGRTQAELDNWCMYSGVVLFMNFSGYLLPWDQLALLGSYHRFKYRRLLQGTNRYSGYYPGTGYRRISSRNC